MGVMVYPDGTRRFTTPELRMVDARLEWKGLPSIREMMVRGMPDAAIAETVQVVRRPPATSTVRGWCQAIRRHEDLDREGAPNAVCGAGHFCCGVASEPPHHDHFLSPGDCPKCEKQRGGA